MDTIRVLYIHPNLHTSGQQNAGTVNVGEMTGRGRVTSHQVEKASIYTFIHSIKIWHMSGVVCGLHRVYSPVSKNKLISNSDKYNEKNPQNPQTNQ